MDGWKIRPQKESICRDSAHIKAENRREKCSISWSKSPSPKLTFALKFTASNPWFFAGKYPQLNLAC
jgi:hypothetical protein